MEGPSGVFTAAMLESYITPVLMSYVDKYIKNLKPSDLSLSLWGGDVVLYNLELRLDVLEKVRKIATSVLVLMSTSFSDKPRMIKIFIVRILMF